MLSSTQIKQRPQRTLKKAVSFSGIGVHTGQEVQMRFAPAEIGFGIVFKRIDLPGCPLVPATIANVCDTQRSTSIGIGSVRIHTVEHVLAALRAYNIDNLLIEISNMEPPIGNGSSDRFVEMIQDAGIQDQEASQTTQRLTKPIHWSEGEIHLVALPDDEYRISYTLHYPETKAMQSQFYSILVNQENFKKEIAPCRTFSLYEEVAKLIDYGLIKGGSLDNAVVIKDDVVFSREGLRFPDEMVRHKILDLIGDLALVGIPFTAHIIAVRSGHASNHQLAKLIYSNLEKEAPTVSKKPNQSSPLDVKDVVKILPHRYPFLLVDKVLELDLERGYILGQKNVTINEAFFQGHFPDAPIMPGVLILEALAQTGGVLVHLKSNSEKIAVLLNVNQAKFRYPVRPGDVLLLRGEGLHFSAKGGRMKMQALVNEKVAVEAEIGFALVDKNQI